MSGISPQLKGEKVLVARDDGTTIELTVGEALRAYEAAHRAILRDMSRTKITVGRCDKQCHTCASSKVRQKDSPKS